ncbi:MAG: restriction endonuclease subunit S [Candidatus Aenigmarchaeota archaeon]|nr:restriction endonuclease subunit S [Candidatus Aenigmarchaeota archaeon]
MISFNKHKEFKDTEIGRIPKEWKVVEVAKLGEVVTGTTPSTKNTDFNKKKIIKITERKVSKEGIEKARIISKNSVMVTCIASIGEVALSSHDCITNQQINTIICKEGIDPEFVYYFLLNSKARLKRWAGITTSPIIKKSFFEKFPILLPPISEQQKIAEVLSTVKKGLMNDLLTGKKRVK